MKSVLFIHRSVGQNLLDDGKLREALDRSTDNSGLSVELKDINNNENKKIPGPDTKPANYLEYFQETKVQADLVVIKSCYPNNAIKSDKDLEDLKQTYTDLINAFLEHSSGKLLLMTTPPLRPFWTNKGEAKRARTLATWLAGQQFGSRIRVFNFYNLLADREDPKDKNMLRKQYRRLFFWDNHPNKKASIVICPDLAKAIIDFLK